MSEEKEVCPKCGSAVFGILRDMTSRRVCKCGNTWDAPKLDKTTHKLPDNRQAMGVANEVKTMTTRKIIFDSKNIPCDIAYVEWVLKSDYDALKQLSDAFYLKQIQLENQNEELKYQLADLSEKYKIAMDKGVDVLSAEIKALKSKLKKANKLINEFDPDENFVFEDGSEELEESVREYLKGEG